MGKREHIYEIIAENIRKERRRLGITQAELAERADVSLDTIKSVENGRRAMELKRGSCVLSCNSRKFPASYTQVFRKSTSISL